MKNNNKLISIIALVVFMLTGFFTTAQKANLNNNQRTSPTTYLGESVNGFVDNHHLPYEILSMRLKTIVVIDKSYSITDQANFAQENGLRQLAHFTNKRDGELTLTTFGISSKKFLRSYRSISDHVERPIKKQRGDTPQEHRQKILRWKNSKKGNSEADVNEFFQHPDVQAMLDYSHLEGASDVLGGLDMAARYLNESDNELRYARNIAILVTDGKDNTRLYDVPEQFNGVIYVVHRSADIGELTPYVRQENVFHSFDAVVRHILNNY